jgi:seryl-tRNA synthetase
MLPVKYIRENQDMVITALGHKGFPTEGVHAILTLDEELRLLQSQADSLKAERNSTSKEIAQLKSSGGDAGQLIDAMGRLSNEIKELDKTLHLKQQTLRKQLFEVPNLPHASSPVGKDESDNVVVETVGEVRKMEFGGLEQQDLLVNLGLVDFEAGARMSGKGFPVYTGQGAKLERALINFMLDIQTNEHGYTEIFPPFIVQRDAATTTGQLPKLEEDMYVTTLDDMFLIPTAEVPVTNFFKDQVLQEDELPQSFTAYSACFRREAGSYGKDTKGLLRLHQFNKVELVKFTRPDESYTALEELRGHAEEILKRLGLAYRVLELATGDLSFAAAKCYDLELWAPATGRWLEVSSCSNFEAFQARRGNIKYRRSDNGKLDFVHTLNGSGVATPRLLVALLENYQQPDGSVKLPEALAAYFGGDRVEPVQ